MHHHMSSLKSLRALFTMINSNNDSEQSNKKKLFVSHILLKKSEHKLSHTQLSLMCEKFKLKIQQLIINTPSSRYQDKYIQSQSQLIERKRNSQVSLKNVDLSTNDYITKMTDGDIILNSTDCINCNRLFYLDQILDNNSCNCPNYSGLSQPEFRTKQILSRHLVATANQPMGGILLCGMKTFSNTEIKGMILGKSSIEDVKKYLDNIAKQLKSADKNIEISHKLVRVFNSRFNCSQKLDVSEKNRYLVVVSAIPVNPTKLCCYYTKNTGFNEKYEVCYLERVRDFQNKERVELRSVDYPDLKMIQKHRKQVKGRQLSSNLHFKGTICCKQPVTSLSEIIKENEEASEMEGDSNSEPEQQMDEAGKKKFLSEQQPRFDLKNRSLLIVPSEKKVKYINMLKRLLERNGHKFQISKFFEKIIPMRGPIVFMFSYETKVHAMMSQVTEFDRNKHIVMIPIYKSMTVSSQELMKHQKDLLAEVNRWYPSQIEIEKEENTDKYKISSKNINSLLLAYLWLQNHNIRPYMNEKISQ